MAEQITIRKLILLQGYYLIHKSFLIILYVGPRHFEGAYPTCLCALWLLVLVSLPESRQQPGLQGRLADEALLPLRCCLLEQQ